MNDFTKTELSEIKRCLKYMIDGGTTPYSCLTISLHKKVRQMIDNYCEHQEMQTNSEVDCITTCASCDKVLKHE